MHLIEKECGCVFHPWDNKDDPQLACRKHRLEAEQRGQQAERERCLAHVYKFAATWIRLTAEEYGMTAEQLLDAIQRDQPKEPSLGYEDESSNE